MEIRDSEMSLVFLFYTLQNEEAYERKESSSA